MIQELLGGGQGEPNSKIAAAGGFSSTSPLSSSPSSPTAPPFSSSSAADQQNLKCPRCDSTNTKFCYYNNYNLTQPRHFCKTCRRYWTKGGALRNVPIGGGCRKAKNNGGGAAAICRSTKAKSLIKSTLDSLTINPHGFDQDLPPNQILWSTPSNSHLLSLLRSTVVPPNPNPNPNSARTKEEGSLSMSHLVPDASLLRNALNARNLGFDYLSQAPLGLSTPWMNNQQPEGGFLVGETAATGIQEIYQRMRSNGQYFSDRHGKSLGEVGSQSSPTIFSFSPSGNVSAAAGGGGGAEMGGGELGYWGSPYAWADMPAMNGSFP